jgi:uncharacterized protein with GYD domain
LGVRNNPYRDRKSERDPTRQSVAESTKNPETLAQAGVKSKAVYCTLRRYGTIGIFEGPDERMLMKATTDAFDWTAVEMHTIVPIEEEAELLE